MSSGFLVDKMPSIIREIGNHSWNVRLREKKMHENLIWITLPVYISLSTLFQWLYDKNIKKYIYLYFLLSSSSWLFRQMIPLLEHIL